MVLDLISGNFKSLLQIKSVSIDDQWDQLNRTYLVMFCILSGTIMTFKQNLGSIIHCIGDSRSGEGSFAEVHDTFVQDYCAAQGLYTVKEVYKKSWPDEVPYPGVLPLTTSICKGRVFWNGSNIPCRDEKDLKPVTEVYHVWYMFVPFYFCAVGIAFYFPYTVFRHLSGIYDIKPMLNTLTCNIEPYTEDDLSRKVDNVSRWLYIKLDPYMNNMLPYTQIIHKHSIFYTVMLVKVMYLTTSIAVFYATNKIFEQGNFAMYGYDVLMSIPQGEDYKVMDTIFPKMVNCRIQVWGPTGLQTEALLCVLPQNIGNQYFFLIFWALLILIMLSNLVSVIVTIFRFCFVAGSYKRFLTASLLDHEERYKLVFTHVGTTGRYILQLCAEVSNPKIFEDLLEIVCSLLISNYHKRKRSREHQKERAGKSRTRNNYDDSAV